MHAYGLREVEKLLRLSRSTIRSLIKAGFVAPARGARRAWRFSFQDLIVLRAAQALVAAKVPPARILRSLKALRRQLPQAMPLSGLSIGAEGSRVVVKDGAGRWQAETGQYVLAFEGDPAAGSFQIIERKAPAAASPDPYRLHDEGRLKEAEQAYRAAIAAGDGDPVLHYNLGVLLEESGRKDEALGCYEAALAADPRFADCHYNLALLCESLGKPREAIRHMAEYRRLTRRR